MPFWSHRAKPADEAAVASSDVSPSSQEMSMSAVHPVSQAARDDLPPIGSTLLSMRGLEKSFPAGAGRLFVLRRITFDIARGEFVSRSEERRVGKGCRSRRVAVY